MAGARVEAEGQTQGASLEAFYSRLGIAVMGTAMDGDCGIDCMCAMRVPSFMLKRGSRAAREKDWDASPRWGESQADMWRKRGKKHTTRERTYMSLYKKRKQYRNYTC